MDSPSLGSPQPTVLSPRECEAGDVSQTEQRTGRATRADVVLVASFGNPVAADYAAFVSQSSLGGAVVVADEKIRRLVEPPVRSLSMDEFLNSPPDIGSEHGRVPSLVLFVNSRLNARERRELDELLGTARRSQTGFVGIVSTFRLHLDDPDVMEVENYVLSRASDLSARVAVFRPGHVLSRHSSTSRFLQRFAPFYPLVPKRLSSCFIEGTEFFVAVETERLEGRRRAGPDDPWLTADQAAVPHPDGRSVGGKDRAYTLLGPNRPWREMLFRHQVTSSRQFLTTAVSMLLSWLLVGHVLALVLTLLARRFPWLSQWNVHTLKPRSMRELLSLCHRYNFGHVKVVGYNNGVNHFGHRYPGRTILSTIHCRRMAHAGRHTLKADCGATVRNALDFLARNNQELYVVPNYSYVCLGTSFFVPIHGSAVDFSTVADTICRVVLYDPDSDRIISAARDDVAFREHVYDQQSRVVVLRLYILAKPKSSYFVHRETLENPSASDLLSALRDPHSTNVEIRQSQAKSAKVTVARYYKDLGDTSSPALELPRDALGRLWDRLEENPVTSYLMHALTRHVAWHTELFFGPREFELFWQTHNQVPLRKIQLRYLRRDGLPHSPCRDEDCVSSDMFIFRWSKSRFLEYLQKTFSIVRTNPGKHSN
jgi:hypothetical protein